MSDVVPSFFPTPHEIAGGLRWMREHPVVATAAAAAATAVSVLTYLKARAELDGDGRAADASAGDARSTTTSKSLVETPSRERFPTWSDSDEDLHATAETAAAAQATAAAATATAADSALLLHTSKHQRTRGDDEVYSATESEVSTTSPTVRRSHPNSASVSNFAFSCAADQDEEPSAAQSASAAVERERMAEDVRALTKDVAGLRFGFPESVLEEDEDNSASPQWGWYVSTTPPDEYYA